MRSLAFSLLALLALLVGPVLAPERLRSASVLAAEVVRIDLNSATAQELMQLPGVGEATANKIIAGRPYKSVDGLEAAGVNKPTIEKIKNLVTVKAPTTKPAAKAPGKEAAAEKVNLNTATAEQLMTLPGVGEATAKKIIANRPYRSYEELEKAAVSAATVEKIRPMATLRTPSAGVADKVDLNSAAEDELLELPGVGEATARKIIAGRPYKSVAELEKAGVSKATVEKITPLVTVKPPVSEAVKPKVTDKKAVAEEDDEATTPARTPPKPGMVWVNTNSKLFHSEGSRWYGKTREGQFMTEADAIKWGAKQATQK